MFSKRFFVAVLLGPLFPLPLAAVTTTNTPSAYMVENTTGTSPTGQACYDFQTNPTCSATITNINISTGTFPLAKVSTLTWLIPNYNQSYNANVNVKDFGATGNGSTDDTAAILSAITFASAKGNNIFVPAGTYVISSSLTFTNAGMIGEGYSSILSPTNSLMSASTQAVVNIEGHYLEFRNFEILGSTFTTGGSASNFSAIYYGAGGGGDKLNNIEINGAAIGMTLVNENNGQFTKLFLINVSTGIQSGGVASEFVGDTYWRDIEIQPTTAGSGWIMDMNTNAQYIRRLTILGGNVGLWVRGNGSYSGVSPVPPENIVIGGESVINAQNNQGLYIQRGFDIYLKHSIIDGQSTGSAIVIQSTSSPVNIDGIDIEANFIAGSGNDNIDISSACNVSIRDNTVYAAGSGHADIVLYSNTCGTHYVENNMCGTPLWGNNASAQTYCLQINSTAFGSSFSNFPNRLYVTGNYMDGNVTGDILDNSPSTLLKTIGPNFGNNGLNVINASSTTIGNASTNANYIFGTGSSKLNTFSRLCASAGTSGGVKPASDDSFGGIGCGWNLNGTGETDLWSLYDAAAGGYDFRIKTGASTDFDAVEISTKSITINGNIVGTGNALCMTAGNLLGRCTTVVGAGGGCTCVSP